MPAAWFRFASSLVPLLDPPRSAGWIACTFTGRQSYKHLIESLGIPHTEIGRLRFEPVSIDRKEALLEDLALDGEHVEVFSLEPFALPELEASFILDNHLGKLASYLRILGFDVRYHNNFQDEELARLARDEDRILVTRDKRLLMRKMIRRGACLRSLEPRDQLMELNRRYGLAGLARPFQRCPRCNGLLERVAKTEILDRLEPLTKRYFDEFHRCASCGQVYWKGSHFEHMLRLVQSLTGPA